MSEHDDTTMAERIAAVRAAHLADTSAERWQRMVPPKYRGATLDLLEAKPRELLSEWAFGPEGRNVLVAGPVGVGKTFAAFAAVRPFVEAGSSVVFWPTVRLLDALRPGGDDLAYTTAMACDLLVLDDLGAERVTDWSAERFYAIVNERWMYDRPIIVTTNAASSDELANLTGERLRSRLLGHRDVVVRLAGDDRRRTDPMA